MNAKQENGRGATDSIQARIEAIRQKVPAEVLRELATLWMADFTDGGFSQFMR